MICVGLNGITRNYNQEPQTQSSKINESSQKTHGSTVSVVAVDGWPQQPKNTGFWGLRPKIMGMYCYILARSMDRFVQFYQPVSES